MPSLTLDTDQLSVQKVGFSTNLVYGTNFNLSFFLVKSGIGYSANVADTVTVVIYTANQRISSSAVQNLCVVGAPSLLSSPGINGGLSYISVNVSLLTAQLAALCQANGNTVPVMMHVTYTQADGESYA